MRGTSILALALCGAIAACTSEVTPSEAPAGGSTGAAPTESPAAETAVRTVKFTVDGLT
jgi:hypothetical protein